MRVLETKQFTFCLFQELFFFQKATFKFIFKEKYEKKKIKKISKEKNAKFRFKFFF